MSAFRSLTLLVAVSSLAACAEPGGPADLIDGCDGLCDQASAAPSPFDRVGRFGPPTPVVCQLTLDDHRVTCKWLGSGEHPMAVRSATVTVTAGGQPSRELGQLGGQNDLLSATLPPDASSVRVSTRMTLDDAASTALGTSSLSPSSTETVLDASAPVALIAPPAELWRIELLGYDAPTALQLASAEPSDVVDLVPGARKTVDVAVARDARQIPYSLQTSSGPITGVLSAPAVLAVSDRGLVAPAAEDLPRAGSGQVAMTCTRSDGYIRCRNPGAIRADIGKITVRAWSPAGDWREFQVSPYFGGGTPFPDGTDAVTLRAYVHLDDSVLGLPEDVPPSFEVEDRLRVGETADFYLPVNLITLILGCTDGPETLVFDVPTLELGRTLEGWYEFVPDPASVTVGRQQLDTVVTVAVPATDDVVEATLKYGDGTTGQPVELRSGPWWVGPSGFKGGL